MPVIVPLEIPGKVGLPAEPPFKFPVVLITMVAFLVGSTAPVVGSTAPVTVTVGAVV